MKPIALIAILSAFNVSGLGADSKPMPPLKAEQDRATSQYNAGQPRTAMEIADGRAR